MSKNLTTALCTEKKKKKKKKINKNFWMKKIKLKMIK